MVQRVVSKSVGKNVLIVKMSSQEVWEVVGQELFGKVTPLASLVEYQKGAIVSRTLLRTVSGHIVLFAFDAGQELSEHTSPYEVIVWELKVKLISH